jgi:hypothetical protein
MGAANVLPAPLRTDALPEDDDPGELPPLLLHAAAISATAAAPALTAIVCWPRLRRTILIAVPPASAGVRAYLCGRLFI